MLFCEKAGMCFANVSCPGMPASFFSPQTQTMTHFQEILLQIRVSPVSVVARPKLTWLFLLLIPLASTLKCRIWVIRDSDNISHRYNL
jgi:hypothetical protein